jgi:hypothetical protein
MASRDAHRLSECWIDMKLWRIEVTDCIHIKTLGQNGAHGPDAPLQCARRRT